MALPSNYVRITSLTFATGGKTQNSVFWYQANTNPPPEEAGALALVVAQNWATIFAPLFKAFFSVDGYFVGTDVSWCIDGATYTAFSADGAAPGAIAGDETPQQNAVIIQKRTANPGKSGRGRWYIGPVAEGLIDNQRLTVAGETAGNAFAAAAVTDLMVDPDYVLKPSHLSTGSTLIHLTSTRCLQALGSQLRRRVQPRR